MTSLTHLPSTKCCSSRQSPDEARFRDGNFDRWDVDQAFSVGWRVDHAYALSKSVENPSSIHDAEDM